VLSVKLPEELEVDLVAVTRRGATPSEGGVLFGAPGLWQRRYTDSRRSRLRSVRPRPTSLEALVRRGEALFFEETFGGNGRTCRTCHPAENNFAIEREFIASLPDDAPLFVAAFLRVLNALENVRSAEAAVRGLARARNPQIALGVAAADTADAAQVLAAGSLHPGAERELRAAEALLQRAAGRSRDRRTLLPNALARLESARRQLVASR
jgi:hypothetical protein